MAQAPIFKEAQTQATSIFAIIVSFLFQTTENKPIERNECNVKQPHPQDKICNSLYEVEDLNIKEGINMKLLNRIEDDLLSKQLLLVHLPPSVVSCDVCLQTR